MGVWTRIKIIELLKQQGPFGVNDMSGMLGISRLPYFTISRFPVTPQWSTMKAKVIGFLITAAQLSGSTL